MKREYHRSGLSGYCSSQTEDQQGPNQGGFASNYYQIVNKYGHKINEKYMYKTIAENSVHRINRIIKFLNTTEALVRRIDVAGRSKIMMTVLENMEAIVAWKLTDFLQYRFLDL